MDSFWQSLLSNWVAWAVIAGGGVLLAYLRKKHPNWASIAIYGLSGAALIAAILIAIVDYQAIPSGKQRVTEDNIESYIKSWAEMNGLGITKPQMGIPDTYFTYVITLKNANSITLFRTKGNPRRLDMHATIGLTEENQKRFSALSKEETTDFIQEVSLQLGLAKLGNAIVSATPITTSSNVVVPFGPQLNVEVFRAPFITDLDEETFVKTVDEIDSGISIVKATMIMGLKPKKADKR